MSFTSVGTSAGTPAGSNRSRNSSGNKVTLLGSALAFACVLPTVAMASEVASLSASEAEAVANTNPEVIVNGKIISNANPNADAAAPYKVDRSSSGKMTEPVRDTPRSVTIIPKEVMEDIGALSFRDLVRSQPGVTLGTGEGGNSFGDRIFIRGFEARNDVYIDNMRDPGVSSREIFAVEQVEVVKGPSSAFGGRGTTGGAVSIQSKQPLDNAFASVEGTIGTDNLYRLTTDINQKLSDTLTIRVNGLFHSSNTPGRDYVDSERWGGAAAVKWEPTERLTMAVDYYYNRGDGMADWGVPFDSRSQEPFDVDRNNFYGVLDRDFMENRASIVTGKIEYQALDNLKLSSRTRYGRTRVSYVASAPESPSITNPDPNLWTVRANPKSRNAITEYVATQFDGTLNLQTFGVKHTIVAGVEYSEEKINNRGYAYMISEAEGDIIVSPAAILLNLWNPDSNVAFPYDVTLSGARTISKVDSYALYIVDTIDFTPQWKMTLGARYDNYDISVNAINAAGATTTDLGQKDDFLNWQASLAYKPVEEATVYASFNTSSNPSGEQIDGNGVGYGGLGNQTLNLDPERNKAYEIGVKWEVADGHLLLTAAAFQIDKTNARVAAAGGAGGVQVLDGKQRVKGFELGASGNLTPQLSLFGGFTYLDAKVRETATQAGGVFPNVPKYSGSLLATYAVTPDFTVGGQAFYSSTRYGGSTIGGNAHLDGYWRFDAVARYKLNDQTEFRLNVLNVTNEVYYDAIYRSGSPFAYIAPGRSANLAVSYVF